MRSGLRSDKASRQDQGSPTNHSGEESTRVPNIEGGRMRSFFKPLRPRLAILAAGALAGPGLAVFAVLPAPAHAAIPPNPAWESTAPFGTWDNGGFDVYNN